MTFDDYLAELDRVWPWIKKSLDYYGPTHTKEDVRNLMRDGSVQLWPTPNAAVITTVDTYPTGHKELRVWVAGGKLSEIAATEPIITAFAKKHNCRRLVVSGRDGWQRLFKAEKKAITIIREL